MGKIAFLFSGQGAQAPGMGKNLYETSPSARELFDVCEEIKPGTLEMMFNGQSDELSLTENAQPCLYLCDLAAAYALNERGVKADAVCGFSLGEIPALAYAQSYTAKQGFELVLKRAGAMAAATLSNPSTMVAVVKLSAKDVIDACSIQDVYPVNFNCPGQVSVALKKEKIPELEARVKALGGRVLPLKVSGGFHSPFMDEAARAFSACIDEYELKKPTVTAYSNVTARPYDEDVAVLLKKQINNPVRWEDTILHLAKNGFDTFIETGVGCTLQKLVLKILPDAKCYAVNDIQSLEDTIKELSL